MTKKPFVNALGALTYIALVTAVMSYIEQTQSHKPDTAFAPFIFLSLLTLSAAIMAFIFFYKPLQYLIEGKSREAVDLFIQTVLVFGVIAAVISILLFSGLF